METIEINEQFEQVLNFVNQTNKPLFLTGKAGTGKTTLLKYIKNNTFKQLAIVAPTGVAAINAGGSTIHSFFQFHFGPFLPSFTAENKINYFQKPAHFQKYNLQKIKLLQRLDLLIIDEISMVRSDMIDQIDITLRQTRKIYNKVFGGVQVLFIGDMFQLPPIINNEEWALLNSTYTSPYFFDSYAIKENYPVFIELTKIYRQKENKFVDILNEVRNNKLSLENLKELNSRYNKTITKQEFENNITLTTHNRKADAINNDALNALHSKEYTYKCEVDGVFNDKTYPADELLKLKTGARVMFLKNNSEKNYYNGKIGIVTDLTKDKIKVKCEEDYSEIVVEKEVWSNITYEADKSTKEIKENVIGKFIQFPLRHAWAITIHKSQGLTFDKLIIDAAEAFSAGQVYVALSRCRSLSGLTLSSEIDARKLFNNDEIIAFNNTKQDDKTVGDLFLLSQQEYFKNCIYNIFDFKILEKTNNELLGIVNLHKKHINDVGNGWVEKLNLQVKKITEPALKFETQLNDLFLDYAKNIEFINQRVSKASVYFNKEVSDLITLFKNCELSTESKEAAQDCNSILQEIFEYVSEKNILINSCANGFNIALYSQAKIKKPSELNKINSYASAKNKVTESISNTTNHPILYKRLVAVRDEICEETMKPIYFVASAKTITELCNILPVNHNQLLKIKGFGEAKVKAFGEQFLNVINEYITEFDIELNEIKFEKTTKEKKQKNNKSQSKQQSYELYKQGKSIDEIAKIRNLVPGTILTHLYPYIESNELNVYDFISKENFDLIKNEILKNESNLTLSELKKSLPEVITYNEIKLVQKMVVQKK